MKILLSNDDGFMAPGINVMRDALIADSGIDSVVTIAPDRNKSGASNSLTLERPLRITKQETDFYSVNGTPTDCVHLALTGLYEGVEPDIVISGINAGSNMGDDVIYSGTVAAAMEGRNLGLPAIAVSLASRNEKKHYESGAKAVISLLKKLLLFIADSGISDIKNTAIFNVNVPDLPYDEIKGYQVTRLGRRHKAEPTIRSQDPRGREIFWVGPAGEEADAGEGTDFYAIQQGYISVTPIHIDLTHHAAIDSTKKWLGV